MAGKKVKIVVVGDGYVGKTSLLVSYKTNTFPVEYVPTVFDNFCQEVVVDGQWVNLQLWDTAGQEGFDRLRCLAYPNTDLFMLCFSLDRPSTLKHVKETWFPEVREYGTNVPLVLVGTKLDLRLDTASAIQQSSDSTNSRQLPEDMPVTYKQGREMARSIGAKCYFECSSLTQENVRDTFFESVRVVMNPRYRSLQKRKSVNGCCAIV
ncbi:ras-related C3 botulinum toxin substrate 1-like [Babylonia areolata]|uniref:ras-related C3 botulinum toxin substrate 1-like n=1 Tax=Babylonia areolata TaxID=304850 RepID=UPI003FD4FBEE